MSEFLLSWADSVGVPGCSSIFPASLSSTSGSRMFLLFQRLTQITNGINEPIIKKAPDIRKAGLYDPKLSAISPKNIRDQDQFLLAQSSTVARVQYDESLYTCIRYPRRQRGSQSGQEKRRDNSFQRAPSPVFENFRRAFSPDPTDCPWVSEDGPTLMKCK